MKPILSAIDYYLGELEPIEGVVKTPDEQDAINTLSALGLKTYSHSNVRVTEMAAESMRRTIARAGIAPSEIDAVVFATESTWDVEPKHDRRNPTRVFRTAVYRTIWEAGLTQAYPLGVTFSGCGNLVASLAVAANAIRTQNAKNVMVVVADRQSDVGTRVMFPAVGVISDAAASCIVTGRQVPGFALDDLVLHSDVSLWEADVETDFGRFLIEMARGLKVMGQKMVATSGLEPRDYKYFLPNNYSRSTLRVFCHQLGYKQEQLFLDNVPRVSHAYAADVLINLFDLEAASSLAPGDRVMGLTSGPATWGMVGLSKTAPA
jgi:3-oxoacyl-[acyl-carrier-protein] synthase III